MNLCRPVEAARGLDDRLLAGSQTDRDKYYDRIRRGLDGIEEEVSPCITPTLHKP